MSFSLDLSGFPPHLVINHMHQGNGNKSDVFSALCVRGSVQRGFSKLHFFALRLHLSFFCLLVVLLTLEMLTLMQILADSRAKWGGGISRVFRTGPFQAILQPTAKRGALQTLVGHQDACGNPKRRAAGLSYMKSVFMLVVLL